MGAAHVIHVEVTGKDGTALQSFYSKVFGWDIDTNNPGGYGMFRDADGGITSGIGAAQDGGAGQVTFYVHSEIRPARSSRSRRSVGSDHAPDRGPPETTVALFADPEGHVVGLM